MSTKDKLIARLLERPKDFTWNEVATLMRACDFDLRSGSGSGRMFVHRQTRMKVRLHEPHPRRTILPYMAELLIQALREAGEIE